MTTPDIEAVKQRIDSKLLQRLRFLINGVDLHTVYARGFMNDAVQPHDALAADLTALLAHVEGLEGGAHAPGPPWSWLWSADSLRKVCETPGLCLEYGGSAVCGPCGSKLGALGERPITTENQSISGFAERARSAEARATQAEAERDRLQDALTSAIELSDRRALQADQAESEAAQWKANAADEFLKRQELEGKVREVVGPFATCADYFDIAKEPLPDRTALNHAVTLGHFRAARALLHSIGGE